jgi:hypothetical protein
MTKNLDTHTATFASDIYQPNRRGSPNHEIVTFCAPNLNVGEAHGVT